MTTHKQLNRDWIQRFNERDWAAESACRTTDFTAHMQGAPGPLDGDGWFGYLQMFIAAFPDVQIAVDGEISEGDTVASRWTMTGTHQGEFLGVPPTGRQVTIIGNDFSRMVDGKIAEHWAQFDGLGTMMQLGALGSPEFEDVSAHRLS